jgi:hypothetical protein
MEPDGQSVLDLLNLKALGDDLPLFALHTWDESAAIIKKYLMNTDRRFTVTESEMRASVALFRQYDLSDAEAAAELFFVIQAVIRINPVNVIVYYTAALTPIFRRLGAAIIALRPSGGLSGSIYRSGDEWVHFHHGTMVGCGKGAPPNVRALYSDVPVGAPFRYSNVEYKSVSQPVVVSRLRQTSFPGLLDDRIDYLLAFTIPDGHVTVFVKRCCPKLDVESYRQELQKLLPITVIAGDMEYFGADNNICVLRVFFSPDSARTINRIAAMGDGDFDFTPHITIEGPRYARVRPGEKIRLQAVELRPLHSPLQPLPLVEADYTFDSDEIVSDIMTTRAGVAWNFQRSSVRINAVFGQGRLGVTLRESKIWGTMQGVIVCGERGENAATLGTLGVPFCGVDVQLPHPSWQRRHKSRERQKRWERHLILTVHRMVPPSVADRMRSWLLRFDDCVISTTVPPQSDGVVSLVSEDRLAIFLEEYPALCFDDLESGFQYVSQQPERMAFVGGEASVSVRFAIMPAGSGKTFLSSANSDIYDVDDVLASVEPQLRSMRHRALEDPALWPEVSRIQRRFLLKWAETQSEPVLVLLHSREMVPESMVWAIIAEGKTDLRSHRMSVSERSENPEWAEITALNWSTSPVPVRGSFAELQNYVLSRWRMASHVDISGLVQPWVMRYDATVPKWQWEIIGQAWSDGLRLVACPPAFDGACRMFGMRRVSVQNADGCLNGNRFIRFLPLQYVGHWKFLMTMARSYGHGTMVSLGRVGTNLGFRVFGVGGVLWRIHDERQAFFRVTEDLLSWGLASWPVGVTLLLGRFLKGNFLDEEWIYRSDLHRVALFSISNVINPRDAWKRFTRGTWNWTFNYLNPGPTRAFVKSSHPSRVQMSTHGSRAITHTATGTWTDWMVDTSTIVTGVRALSYDLAFGAYTHPDFLTLSNTIDSDVDTVSFQKSSNPRDGFMNCWMTYSTIMSPGAPWPDQMNTQTWWVKVPTATLRLLHHEDADSQRLVRAKAVSMLTPKAVAIYSEDAGHHYGWLPEFGVSVDPSGHAISMLIMAGVGSVDIGRYWDTVLAMMSEYFRRGKKSVAYKRLIRAGDLTEDAVHHPYKLWHTVWDYRAAVVSYILMGKEQKIPIHPRVIRYSLKRLQRYEEEHPKIKTYSRKRIDASIRNLYNMSLRSAN